MNLRASSLLLALSMTACLKTLPAEAPKAEVITVLPACSQLEINPAPAGCNMIDVMYAVKDQCCKVACATKLFSPIVGCAADIMVASQCTIHDVITATYSACDCDIVPEPQIEPPPEQDVQNIP